MFLVTANPACIGDLIVTDETMPDISKAKELADYALLCFRGPHDEARDNLELR